MSDPVDVNPDLYRVVFENERVRVLEYHDHPGDTAVVHAHPDSVMVTLSAFDRRLTHGGQTREVHFDPFQVRWMDAQEHQGENIGATDTRTIFVELKEPGQAASAADATIGPRQP